MPLKTKCFSSTPAQPKHVQVTDEFRRLILSHDFKPGERLPSYNEIRAQHGVHTNTMEKVYAKLEFEGLIVRRNGSGTFVAEWPGKKPAAKGVIGLSGGGFDFNGASSYWSQIMGGVRAAAREAQRDLLILDAISKRDWEKADGVLVCDWEANRALRNRPPGLPVVSLIAPIPDVASVVADDFSGARLATEYLLGLGHRKIGFLYSQGDQPTFAPRLAGYNAALREAGISPRKNWKRKMSGFFQSGFQFVEAGRHSMLAWMKDGWSESGCTALLCHNDETALGAIKALQSQGVNVPQDISVMGYDGTEFCSFTSPILTSVAVPLREIGAIAVELLMRQIEADAVSTEHRVLPMQLRAGESTAALRPDKTS